MEHKAVILGRRHGATEIEILSGPKSITEQKAAFMEFRDGKKTHPDFESVALAFLDIERVVKFEPDSQQKNSKSKKRTNESA